MEVANNIVTYGSFPGGRSNDSNGRRVEKGIEVHRYGTNYSEKYHVLQPYYHVHICHAELVEASLCLILRTIIISKMPRNEHGEEPRYVAWCLECKRAGFDPIIGDTPTLSGLVYQANRDTWISHGYQLRHRTILIVDMTTEKPIASIFGHSSIIQH